MVKKKGKVREREGHNKMGRRKRKWVRKRDWGKRWERGGRVDFSSAGLCGFWVNRSKASGLWMIDKYVC